MKEINRAAVSDRKFREIVSEVQAFLVEEHVSATVYMEAFTTIITYLTTGECPATVNSEVSDIIAAFNTKIEKSVRRAAAARTAAEKRRAAHAANVERFGSMKDTKIEITYGPGCNPYANDDDNPWDDNDPSSWGDNTY